MNKKGDIPTLLLPVVALAFCVIMLFVFATFDNNFSNSSKEITSMLSEVQFAQDYVIKTVELSGSQVIVDSKANDNQLKLNFQKIMGDRNINYENAGNVFAKVRQGEFSFVKKSDLFVIEIDGLFVKSSTSVDSQVGYASSVKRNFDLTIEFYWNGEVHKVYKQKVSK